MPSELTELSPIKKIAYWSDKIRDNSAAGLQYHTIVYDRDRFEAIQHMAIELLALPLCFGLLC